MAGHGRGRRGATPGVAAVGARADLPPLPHQPRPPLPRSNTRRRIALLAVLIAQAVEEHGSAEVVGVPGDQLKPLRAAARRELRRRLGYDGKTYVHGDFLLVTCDEATEQVRLDMAQETVKSMQLGIPDGRPRDESGWRLRWDTWSTP